MIAVSGQEVVRDGPSCPEIEILPDEPVTQCRIRTL
jgi:hypothetical protein